MQGGAGVRRATRSRRAWHASITLTSKKRCQVRITSKGQVTIPQEIREEAGLLPHTEVEFILEEDGVRIVKAREPRRPTRGDLLIERMKRAKGHVTMTTDEIMALTRSEK